MRKILPQYLLKPLIVLTLTACQGQGTETSIVSDVELRVLSSAPDQVTGGDTLLSMEGLEMLPHRAGLSLLLNGNPVPVDEAFLRNQRVELLLSGLNEGENSVILQNADGTVLSSLDLHNYPLSGPVFSGPQQYPFVCSTMLELGVQPLVDHDEEWGFPVEDEAGNIIGYSRDCSIEPYVEFHYMSTSGEYQPMPEDGTRPDDMAAASLPDGRSVDFIVRWERGTINRFLYSFATLAEQGEDRWRPQGENWNGRLLYHFEGGVGVGHFQGRINDSRARLPLALEQGYAVIYSSGNRTGEHYNLELGGETALMVKEHFIKRFGEPLYTVAIGGSGGAIQQYVYAQNHPGLIDAGVPQYSYPDMVTQAIHVGDCELLEYYMDVTDRENPRWQTTRNRSLLVGFNATDDVPDPFADAKRQLGFSSAAGSTECIPAWRGLTPLTMNPHYGQVREQDKMHPPGIMDEVIWTHYDDLRNILGLDEQGQPRVPWDNVGVQYGLQALREEQISPEEFLQLNARIGGWKHPSEMVQEGFPFLGDPTPENFDPWSSRNMNLSADDSPAPRTRGDLMAMNALYESGMVFQGQLDIPMIDWRHYLEHVLDMHNSHQSFSVRQRLLDTMGHADHQLVWFTDARPQQAFDQTPQALEVLHEWLMNIRANPELSVADTRPAQALDACFRTDGSLIAQGDEVWRGILDDAEPGACTRQFPIYATSRIMAGGPIEGSIFKCQLKPVEVALSDDTYGSWVPDADQSARLQAIFPEGVCDYSQADQARP